MNRKTEAEEIQSELSGLAARREALRADLQSATEAARDATDKIIGGASATAALIATGGARAALQDALAAIAARIDPLQTKLDAAKEAAGEAERAENYAGALAAYDEATAQVARLIREFTEVNAAALQAVDAAHSAVHGAENEMTRADERPHYRASALEYPRPSGDVRPILAQLQDYLQNKTYASVSTPTAPEHTRDLSKAGIV
jgi:chromosome segregation ATPase